MELLEGLEFDLGLFQELSLVLFGGSDPLGPVQGIDLPIVAAELS